MVDSKTPFEWKRIPTFSFLWNRFWHFQCSMLFSVAFPFDSVLSFWNLFVLITKCKYPTKKEIQCFSISYAKYAIRNSRCSIHEHFKRPMIWINRVEWAARFVDFFRKIPLFCMCTDFHSPSLPFFALLLLHCSVYCCRFSSVLKVMHLVRLISQCPYQHTHTHSHLVGVSKLTIT